MTCYETFFVNTFDKAESVQFLLMSEACSFFMQNTFLHKKVTWNYLQLPEK